VADTELIRDIGDFAEHHRGIDRAMSRLLAEILREFPTGPHEAIDEAIYGMWRAMLALDRRSNRGTA
jgi:hypothetical protein